MISNYFNLFSNCIPVKGHNRSLILDVQRDKSFPIPNSMLDVIEFLKSKNSLEKTISHFGVENKIVIEEYLDFLNVNELGFFQTMDEFDLFLALDKNFATPDHISNIVIELSDITIKHFDLIVLNFTSIITSNVQLISYEKLNIYVLFEILNKLKNRDFKSVELVLKFSEELVENINKLEEVLIDITRIIIHNVPENFKDEINIPTLEVIFTKNNIDGFKFCGSVKMDDFSTNQSKVLESLNHNSCLNKKIAIDNEGFIRNCPAMPKHFGSIKDITLEVALNHLDFKKYWNVTKDMITACKDCEFRHICTDCRAYTERTHFEEDIDLSKPLKCGYNPYTNEWAEWSTNPLKQNAIKYYGMQELVKKDA
jgi:SPASM domain peptide maturase of grasp-with-spasm system